MECMPYVAVVDDEEPVRKALRRLLRAAGLQADGYASGQEFLAAAGSAGRKMWKLEPRPATELPHRRPRWASTIEREIERPRPRPCGLVV